MKYIFLALTYFCSSDITEEEINNLEKLLCLCYLVVLLNVGLTGKKILKGWGNGKNYPWAESGIYVFVYERDKSSRFEIHVIILRYIRNVNLSFKKNFKFAELLTKTSFLLYFRDRLEKGERNKQKRRRKNMRKSN